MMSWSSMHATTLREPPQRPHTSMSILNTRLSRWAQDIATCRSEVFMPPSFGGNFTRMFGFVDSRHPCRRKTGHLSDIE